MREAVNLMFTASETRNQPGTGKGGPWLTAHVVSEALGLFSTGVLSSLPLK